MKRVIRRSFHALLLLLSSLAFCAFFWESTPETTWGMRARLITPQPTADGYVIVNYESANDLAGVEQSSSSVHTLSLHISRDTLLDVKVLEKVINSKNIKELHVDFEQRPVRGEAVISLSGTDASFPGITKLSLHSASNTTAMLARCRFPNLKDLRVSSSFAWYEGNEYYEPLLLTLATQITELTKLTSLELSNFKNIENAALEILASSTTIASLSLDRVDLNSCTPGFQKFSRAIFPRLKSLSIAEVEGLRPLDFWRIDRWKLESLSVVRCPLNLDSMFAPPSEQRYEGYQSFRSIRNLEYQPMRGAPPEVLKCLLGGRHYEERANFPSLESLKLKVSAGKYNPEQLTPLFARAKQLRSLQVWAIDGDWSSLPSHLEDLALLTTLGLDGECFTSERALLSFEKLQQVRTLHLYCLQSEVGPKVLESISKMLRLEEFRYGVDTDRLRSEKWVYNGVVHDLRSLKHLNRLGIPLSHGCDAQYVQKLVESREDWEFLDLGDAVVRWNWIQPLLKSGKLKDFRCGTLVGVTQDQFIKEAERSGLHTISFALVNDVSEKGNKWDLEELRRKLTLIWFYDVWVV